MRAALLLCTALIMPVPAEAGPVISFFAGIATGFTTGAVAGAGIGGAFAAGLSIGSFFTGTLGSLLLNVGLSFGMALLNKPKTPDIEQARANPRIIDSPRYQLCGPVAVGGHVGTFGEYDADGNFWYIVAHGDGELLNDPIYLLDNIRVELATEPTVDLTADAIIAENVPLSGEYEYKDGYFTVGNKVLLVAQTDPIENGLWVTSSGAWSRHPSMASGDDIKLFVVDRGTASLPGWNDVRIPRYFSVLEPSGVVGTDPMVWSAGQSQIAVGDVITDDFCLTEKYNQFTGTGGRVPYLRIYTVSPTPSQVYGTKPTDFTDAFPELPTDFFLAGLVYSVVRCKAIPPEHYGRAYRWRGAFALGEPSVAMYGDFTRVYDPRDVTQDINDRATWKSSGGNSALIWGWFRTAPYGRKKPLSEINWAQVGAQADVCDETVLDRTGTPVPRYRGGFAIADNTPRHEAEADILLTCDGFSVYDDQGRAWPRVGKYESPTLTFTEARDILSAETQILDDGETALDGVIVNYISADHGYTKQPSAPWRNAAYYDGTTEPNYQTVDILGCQNHNQAVRLAKAIGQRVGATRRAAFSVGVKGILVRGERGVNVDYSSDFVGEFELGTSVEIAPDGRGAAFAVVPLQSDRWDLGLGEEGAPPPIAPALDIDGSLEVAQNVDVSAVSVAASGGAGVRLEVTFDEPTRVDRSYRFRYRAGADAPEYFITDMDELIAYSALVDDGTEYVVSWQTVTAGGRATPWSNERDTPESVTITATANPTAPADLVAFNAADGVGESIVTFTTANDANQFKVQIYRGTTTTFGDAALIETVIAAANIANSATNTGLAAGTYYFWAVPLNGSNVAGTASGPDTAIIT
ncbi:hypothetical protein [Oceaniglobus ichthyenteri]|uniref:hypothetical protein n=1 Tax=Oceaniglobus ichthyenteri TaxID=2136177 RepID=UPI000F81C729|nr:hypothetical protein [Oceaniglobus ichthyenteri]